MKPLLLTGGQIVTHESVFDSDILIRGEKIEAVQPKFEISGDDPDIIEINGLTVFPGLIDIHVHLREPGDEHKEDFTTGTGAALAGGITSVVAMPNTSPPITNAETLAMVLELATKKAVCDYGLYVGGTPDNANEVAELGSAAGLKLYIGSSTGSLLVDQLPAQLAHFDRYPKYKVLAVHAEDEAAVNYFAKLGQRRPPICAALATTHVIALAEHFKRRLHICHVSTGYEVSMIRAAKERGLDITCEVTPHHLFLSAADEASLRAFGQVNPPLRSSGDVDSLWSQISTIDCIATDHAPHTRDEKSGTPVPSGMPGLETSLSLMLTAAANKNVTLPQIAQLTSYRPAQIMGFATKGRLAPGYDADLTLVDLREDWRVNDADMHSRCGWTPFAGHQLKGRVKQVYLRGKRVYSNGGIEVVPGYGKVLKQS